MCTRPYLVEFDITEKDGSLSYAINFRPHIDNLRRVSSRLDKSYDMRKNGSDLCLHAPMSLLDDQGELRYMLLPCGKCLECRLQRSRAWADRLCLEQKMTDLAGKKSWFLTLTYDDQHLPAGGSLCPRDMTLFLKRLRKTGDFRYFYAGEYGSKLGRPHYHMILFGFDLSDLVMHSKTPTGNLLYTSDFLNRIWQNGFVVVGEMTWNSAAYVSRYTAKQDADFKKDIYEDAGLVPPFIRMSNRPGIGFAYYEKYKDSLFDLSKLSISNGRLCDIPEYFYRKLKDENPSLWNKKKLEKLVNSVDVLEKTMYNRSEDSYGSVLDRRNLLLTRRTEILRKEDSPV